MRKQKKLTPEQVKKVVAEVDKWNNSLIGTNLYKVHWVTHLHGIPGEYYLIHYENFTTHVFRREQDGKLHGVLWTTYFGPHWTDVPRSLKSKQQEEEQSKPEEE